MKASRSKTLAMLLVFLLVMPLLTNQNAAVAYAATPKFADSSIELVGKGETYQFKINNAVKGSTYKWSSSKTKVATISGSGVVTAVGKGTSTIKCIITYPSGSSKTISGKVKVIIPATAVKINNAMIVQGAHELLVGEEYNFNRDLTPSASSDKTYWSIGGGDSDCIKITNSSKGIVKATKVGKVILVATAAKKATKEYAQQSLVRDAIIINVVNPTATVSSATITSSTELKIIFDSQIDERSIIDDDGKLLDSIGIVAKADAKGKASKDPGKLKAALASDLKTVTITAANAFDGQYAVNITNNVKTTGGVAIEPYYKLLAFEDTIAPAIDGITLDDSGLVATINFTEVVDFTNLKVSNATLVTTSSNKSADETTLDILNNRLNYVAGDDGKSLTINLSNIDEDDHDKIFYVILSGIKDVSGNVPVNAYLTAYLYTDTKEKAQARPMSVLRTSYYTITATFNRAIKNPGYMTIGGTAITGIIDEKDNTKVNFALTDRLAKYTGVQKVSIGHWDAYNVLLSDTYADIMRDFNVNFTVDSTTPVLRSYKFDADTDVLSLTYNKEVTLSSTSGIFSATLVTESEDIISGTNVYYTKEKSDDAKVIKLKLDNVGKSGEYSFTIKEAFVVDHYLNKSLEKSITISNLGDSSSELPGPTSVTQSTTNLSEIYLVFDHKLDVTSAETVSNYSITGVKIASAKVKENSSENGAKVLLTVADGTIAYEVSRTLTISGVKGYNGSYLPITKYTTSIVLADNTNPHYVSIKFDDKNLNKVYIYFSEKIKGSMEVEVSQISSVSSEIKNTVTVEDNYVMITLDRIPVDNSYLKIKVEKNDITDLNGNKATINTVVGVAVSY